MTKYASQFVARDVTGMHGRQPRTHWAVRIGRAILRLAVPVAASVVTLAAAWDLRMVPIAALNDTLASGRPDLFPSLWLTAGHFMVPVIFLLTNLVNRRYGQDYAIAHVLSSWALASLIAIAAINRLDPRLPAVGELPEMRTAIAFVAAFVVAQTFGAFVFDRTRGVIWWHAPLYAALASTFLSMFIFYPAAFFGTDPIWINHMAVDVGVKAAMSFVLLVPYFILRPIIRPMPGFGGF
ncbi:MAG: hypothetical protein GC190_17065 [Alphaproteobacteria bacterium]|nr:hypothetical protein [Alphaproteobacteria bacterium]